MGRVMLLVKVAAPMAAMLALGGGPGPRAPPSRWIRPRRLTEVTGRHSSRDSVKEGEAP